MKTAGIFFIAVALFVTTPATWAFQVFRSSKNHYLVVDHFRTDTDFVRWGELLFVGTPDRLRIVSQNASPNSFRDGGTTTHHLRFGRQVRISRRIGEKRHVVWDTPILGRTRYDLVEDPAITERVRKALASCKLSLESQESSLR